MGAPHLARFSRDVGFHSSTPAILSLHGQPTFRPAESHISRKTSEMWGTHRFAEGYRSHANDYRNKSRMLVPTNGAGKNVSNRIASASTESQRCLPCRRGK